MTLCLLGMELASAQNLLSALGIPYSVTYYAARKPLAQTDSIRVMRQTEEAGLVRLLAGAFQTTAATKAPDADQQN
ncbi:MAG: hypothetical protein WCP73_04100 [Eubacteriales bacterium]